MITTPLRVAGSPKVKVKLLDCHIPGCFACNDQVICLNHHTPSSKKDALFWGTGVPMQTVIITANITVRSSCDQSNHWILFLMKMSEHSSYGMIFLISDHTKRFFWVTIYKLCSCVRWVGGRQYLTGYLVDFSHSTYSWGNTSKDLLRRARRSV